MNRHGDLPGNGRLLRLLGVLHAVVGVAVYRNELRSIGRAGVVAAVPYRGPEATAFWFLVPSPLIWLVGWLLGEAERVGDADAVRTVNRVSAVSATVAVACMPISGFWGWLAISLRGLVQARRMER